MTNKTFIIGIIDGKLHNDEFNIFELDSATASMFVGYNRLHNQTMEQLIAQSIAEFAQNNQIEKILIEDDLHIKSIINDEKFIRYLNELGKNQFVATIAQFENYTNINNTLFLPLNDETLCPLEDLLKKPNTAALNYGGALYLCFADKAFLELFLSRSNSHYPKTQLIHIDLALNNKNTLKEFLNLFQHDYVMIKPTNKTLGHGVTLIAKKQFEAFLNDVVALQNQLLLLKVFAERYFMGDQTIAKHWLKDKYMLVQDYVSGVQKDNYDVTGRLVFKITGNMDLSSFNWQIIGCYWKLPREPQTNPALTANNTISYIYETAEENVSIMMTKDEQIKIEKSLAHTLLPLISKILTTNVSDLINEFLADGSFLHLTYCMNTINRYLSEKQKLVLLDKLQDIYRTTDNITEQQVIISSVLNQMWYPFSEKSFEFMRKIISRKDPKINEFIRKLTKESNLLNMTEILFTEND